MREGELYQEGKNIYEIADIIQISPVAVWRRLKKQGVQMHSGIKKGTHWAAKKRGPEFIGADGRYWVRGIPSGKKRTSKRRAVVVMEKLLGYPIPKGYHVHHIDGNQLNDDPNNLELLTVEEHNRRHHLKTEVPL